MELLNKYGIGMALFGCLFFSIGLHYKKEGQQGKNLKFGKPGWNLNWKGKTLVYIGGILFAQYFLRL